MSSYKRAVIVRCIAFVAGFALMLSFVPVPLFGQMGSKAGRQVRSEKEVRRPDIRRMKSKIVVSRDLAERIREDNSIALSTVAIKLTELPNKDSGFKVVQVDEGGIADRLGFKAGDIVWKVNGLDMNAAKDQIDRLEQLDRFEVLLLRGGKKRTLRFEIR